MFDNDNHAGGLAGPVAMMAHLPNIGKDKKLSLQSPFKHSLVKRCFIMVLNNIFEINPYRWNCHWPNFNPVVSNHDQFDRRLFRFINCGEKNAKKNQWSGKIWSQWCTVSWCAATEHQGNNFLISFYFFIAFSFMVPHCIICCGIFNSNLWLIRSNVMKHFRANIKLLELSIWTD